MDRQQFSAPSVLDDCKDIELTNGQERGHGAQRIMYSDTMELLERTVVVKNGLKLRRQATGIPEDYGSYSYALSPLTVALKGIDWKIIVPSGADIVCDHIHCHEVKPDDNLDELIAECRANHAVAVVLVNRNDNYFLPDTIQSCFTKTDYPVLVLTANDGKKLLQTLQEEDDDGDFEAKVLDKEPAERVPDISKQVELQPYSAIYRKAGDGGKHTDIYKHFRKQLKQFLHHSGHATCVSEDPEQVKQVVAAFDEYEQQLHSMEVFSNPASNQCICDDLNKWRDKCELGKEFPIYLVLAKMLLRSRSLYACTGFDGFINRTVQKIEKLPWRAVAATVQAFVDRGNFEVALSNTTISVFKLLENICETVLENRSLQPHYIKMKSGEKVQKTPIAAKMFWISLTVKFSSHGESEKAVGLLWTDHIITDCEHLTLTDDVIAAVEKGLEFGKQLQLPPEVSFSILHISQFLAQPTYFVRPFKHIRTFLQRIHLMNYLYAESDLAHFMEVLLQSYSSWINECSENLLSWLSTERCLHEAISEGLAFLGELHTLMDKKQWTSKELAHKFQQWLKLLIELVDMKNPEAAQCLKLFLDHKNRVCKEHRKTTHTHVKNLVKANFQEITIKQFYSLYKVFYRQWENTFLQEYLTKYEFQDGERITQVWSEFFQEVVKNYTNPQDHQFLVEFLKRTAQFYAVSYTHFDFLVDLLAIEVPQLFTHKQSGPDHYSEFYTFLQDYVPGCHIEEKLPLILDRLSTVKSQSLFMDLIMAVMMQNFFQKDVTILLLPLRSVVKKLTANNRLEIKMTSPLELFCWRFLADFCSKIEFQTGPNWIEIKLLQPAILELATVCECYCTTKNWSEKERLRAICESKSLPEDISGSLNETVKYFEWVISTQGVLNRWCTQLDGHTVNYDDILHYQQQKPFFQKLSQRLSTPCLVLDESKLKQHFEKRFEELHVLLLRYIGNEPDGKWCTLIELLRHLGIMMPTHIQETLDEYIQFPNERGKKHDPFLQNTIPFPVPSKFMLTEKGLPLPLKATTGLTLKRLNGLVRSLNQFLRPLSTYLDMLIFFTLQESRMFVTYVRYELKRYNTVGDKVQQASKALESTSLLIWDIVNGRAKYRDIVAGRTLNLETLNIDKELHILRSWVTSENPDKVPPDFFTPVKAQLQLSKFATNIDVISKVCTNYDLQGCLEDSQLRKLVDLAAKLKDDVKRDEISLEDAKRHKMEVERALYLQTDSDYKCLDLFPAIADSKDFFTFVQKRQFIGREGQMQFQTFLELITAQLQHDSDEYEQTVLNSLSAAFQLIAPFTDKSQTFSELMLKVVKLDVSHGLVQLETVKNNLHLIDLWISRAEGDTLQNALTDLENVLQTGFFKFLVEECGIYTPPRLVLEYNPFAHKAKEFASSGRVQLEKTSAVQEPSKERPCGTSHTKTWDSGEISSFVQMLGLLDQEKTHHSEKITRFQRLNEIAEKLLGLFTTLKELGHPDYLHTTSPAKILACSDDDQIVKKKVEEAQNSLIVWKHQVEEWNNQYPHLLFFTIPKVLRLHQSLLKTPHVVESAVANDIAFLFCTDKPAQDQLRHSVKKVLGKELPSCLMPMPRVGEFLKSLLNDVELTTFCTPKRYLKGAVQHAPTSNLWWSSAHQFIISVELHYTPGFDKTQLLSIIFGIYQGVPESFEFFRCSSDTTELDLKRFVERIWKHARTYMMFGVNNLSLHLQEVFVQHFESQQALAETSVESTLHCVETSPSSLREIPWIQLKEHQTTDPLVSVENGTTIGRERLLHHTDIEAVYLVYGQPGDGKTHFVKRMLQEKVDYPSVTITVNEGFTSTGAILELNLLTEDAKSPIVFFNFTFTLLPSDYKGCEPKERENFEILMDSISWFFFDLLVLGYVEDRNSGLSFRLPGDLSWTIYVEVPCSCWPEDISDDSSTCLKKSLADFQSEIPVLGLLGTPHLIDHQEPLFVDEDVQLVCKYLRAYHDRTFLWINRLYVETTGIIGKKEGKPVKFSTDKDIPQPACNKLLLTEMSKQIKNSKIIQKLYIRYMHRRCNFLDNCPAFNYNMGCSVPGAEDTSRLGSTLMRAMLKEVADFCNPEILKNWSCKPHQQLIYDYRRGGGAIGYISLNTEKLLKDDVDKLKRIGVQIPTQAELHSREYLDECLSRALNLPLEKQEDGQERLPLIDESGYVLTLDYTIKMLSIHERRECRMPVIIEGETGVGKSALVEMLSKLWNASWKNVQRKNKEHILTFLRKILQDQEKLASDNDSYKACRVELTKMITTAEVREDVLDNILKLPDAKNPQVELFQVVRKYLLKEIRSVCPVEMLRPLKNHKEVKFLFESVSQEVCKETTLELLYALLTPELKQTFYKLQVHAALQPKDIWEFFDGVILQAESLQKVFSTNTSDEGQHFSGAPIVTVFLDELNTSTCGGVFKEIIVDRTMNSKEIPFNVFIIAACNPHRGNSLAPSSPDETWVRGSYYVHRLHPTLRYLMWDYGSLDELQERRYIEAKIKLLHNNLPNTKVDALTNPIVRSQNLMRKYAWEQLLECSLQTSDAEAASKSTVSQRDIQRFFTFYQWFLKMYDTLHRHEGKEQKTRAMLVALSLVYYMRLNSKYREMYKQEMEKEMEADMQVNICFEQVYQSELEWLISKIHLPTGIARTQGLKENLFAIITCTMTHTPLILVGAPGSSKTLSFYLVAENLRGKESDVSEFQRTELFSAIDPLFYQCSRQTTSNEINTVFTRAINRQSTYRGFALPINCVVLMDEAGLPEESLESLKALHYHLDQQDVSFVAITNHILDAAKSNRAVSLVVPDPSKEDLIKLAQDCFCDMYNAETSLPQASISAQSMVSDLVESQAQISPLLSPEVVDYATLSANELIGHCCQGYYELMNLDSAEQELQYPFHKFFGLRDFIYFLGYLRRKLLQELKSVRSPKLTSALLLEGLERNFNGTNSEDFHYICRKFLKAIFQDQDEMQPEFRSVTEILRNSLLETPVNISGHGEVRYKLIIDPSEDSSLIRYMFTFGILRMENTRVHMCSNLGDSHLEKINTIAAIRHSAVEGHTVILSQIDSIQESFYDLFNQRFRCIKNPVTNEHRYYANVAIGAHSKPCRVDPDFQCIVLLKESELSATPAPFLNRFEKYRITYKSLIEECMTNLPPFMRIILETAVDKVSEFVQVIEAPQSLYGYREETIPSLLLKLLPPPQHVIEPLQKCTPVVSVSRQVSILDTILYNLKLSFGFHIPQMSDQELKSDAEYLFALVQSEIQHSSLEELNISTSTVIETFKILSNPDSSIAQGAIEFTDDIGLIFRLLVQWFIHYLCKSLMQLMTPEALALLYKRIPESYSWSYLVLQEHFSLKCLLSHYCELQETSERSDTCAINKVLCFSRSTPKFPPYYSRETNTDANMAFFLEKAVFRDVNKLVVMKLSVSTSQRNIREFLKKFSLSPDDRVLLLTVNALEISHDAINHLRILIDEAETLSLGKKKLFVLLLHFSDVVFGRLSYPSLFLEGWDHHYINFVSTAHPEYIVDTKQWFKHSIFPQPGNLLSSEENMLEVVNNLFPILTSRVGFTAPTAERSSDMLKKLLFNNDSHVGKALCRRFLGYWTPQKTAEYLHQAAYSIQKSDSTLWLSDTLQKMFKSKFFDYLIYMVSKIHADCNILHLTELNHLDTIMKLFVDIILTYPCPKLSQLKLNSMLGSIPSTVFCEHRFPFFGLLSKLVDDEIDHCKELGPLLEPAKADDDHDEIHHPSKHANVMEFQLVDEAQKRLCQVVEGKDHSCLAVAINRLAESDELWYIYFSDFAREKLHVGGETSDTIIKRLSQWHQQKVHQISKQGVINCTIAKLVSLHVSVQHLSKVISIVRPIAKLEKIAQKISSEGVITFPQLEPEGSIFEKPEDICLCVVSSLFQPLVQTLIGQTSVEPLKTLAGSWNAVYQMMISIPLFKKWIYEHLSSQTEAKFNLMHTMYLVYSFDPSDEECRDTSNVIFGTLYNRYFEPEKHEIKTECPHLQQLADVVLGTLVHKRDTKHIVYVIEGLLEHCFSEYHKQYHSKDIQWFLELVNQQVWEEIYGRDSTARGHLLDALKSEISEEHVPSGSIPLNVFKFYLVRILSKNKNVSHRHSVVVPWNNEARLTIGKVLVTAHQSSDPPGSYIPPFYANYYTQCKQKTLMQQPLAHLYFYTTLEYVIPFFHKKKLSGMLEFVDAIEQEYQGSEEAHEQVMLLIEKQALVQTIIRESARALATGKGREAIVVLKDDLNHLFDDEDTGGSRADGKPSGHGVALAMHTVWQMKSFEKFLHLPDGNILMDIKCLKPFFCSEVGRRNLPTCHLFPFMLPDAVQSQDTIALATLYQQLCKRMCDVHHSNGASTKAKIQALLRFTEKKLHDHLPITSSHIKGEKAACTRLFLWLCTYHEFYKKNIKSEELANAMKERKMVELLGGEQYAQLIQCFLNPDLMVAGRECVAKSLPHVSRHEPDPLYALFHTSDLNHPSSSDIELRHAIANVVAAVLGSPERTTHLWWHLFSPDELANTYMTGFLFDAPVSREKSTFYNYGVQLKSSGIYAKHSYHKHATRGTLSLHSLYLLLWMNFSAFCIGLITRPNTEKQLRMLLSDELPVRSYCVSQVRSLWSFMRNNLLALDEELAFLIQRCSNSLLQKSLVIKGSSHGRFDTKDKLNVYEWWWHTQIFMPSKQEMNEQFLVHSGLCNHESFQDIRLMAINYPKFPTENEFLQHVLGFADEQDPCIQLVLQFALEYPRLEIACSLLPELVELYWWLHTDLAHMISRDTAQKTTVKQLMAHLQKYYQNDHEKLKKLHLFNSVKDHFNQYTHTTGVIPDDDNALLNPREFKIEDNTLIIQLLSVPLQTDQKSNDQLYKVIMELVKTHNHIMELLSKVAASCSHEPLCCHVIADTNKVYLPEVSENTSFVENFTKIYQQSKYLQLIRRRCVTPNLAKEDHTPATLPQFDLHWLLQDIVATFLSGKPQIHNPSTQHIPYCFRVPPNRTRAHLSENAAQELANINHKLPQEYKQSLSDGHLKTLEYRFHNESLETYDEVVTGLTTSAQYLINFLHRSDDILMRVDTLQNFLREVYHREEPSAAFKMAGFTSLSAHQLSCFLDMKLQNVYHALQVFVQWIEDGYYDFRSLPYATKSHLCAEDEQKLQQLQEQAYHGTPMELLKDFKHITVLLNHIEPNIVKIVSTNPQEPIVNHLSVQKGAKVECALVGFIPESVQVHHYVAFRVALRRLTLEVERLLPPNQRREEEHFTKFEGFVTDLWKKRIGHVQRVPGGSFRGEESTQVVSKEVSGYNTDDTYLDEYSEPGDDSSATTTSWQPSSEDSGGDEWVEDEPTNIMETILKEIDLQKHLSLFANEEVTEGNLQELAYEGLLRSIGVKSALDRLKIIMQIQKHKSGVRGTQSCTTTEVAEFLSRTLNMEHYVLFFQDSKIDGDLLLRATDEILEEIGIKSALDRLKIRIAFRREILGPSDLARRYPVAEVVNLLKAHNMDAQYQLLLERNEIDGEMLSEASDQVLIDIGIKSLMHQNYIRKLIQK